jgi:predicted DCC family thiol-disulfide oxidoreductase YuxK
MEKKGIILYDGVCNLCNYAMRFIIKNGGARHYQFVSLQSDLGKQTIDAYGISEKAMSTVILLENKKVSLRSTAILRIIRK